MKICHNCSPYRWLFVSANRLVALVDTEYVLGPGGEYVVFAGSQVRMSCYHALSRSYRPSWQWVGKVDHVFIEGKWTGLEWSYTDELARSCVGSTSCAA